MAHNESVHKMWLRDSLDRESCDGNDLCSSIRKLMEQYACLLRVCHMSVECVYSIYVGVLHVSTVVHGTESLIGIWPRLESAQWL